MRYAQVVAAAAALLVTPLTQAIPLDINDTESIKKAASTVAYDLVSYYSGNESGQTPGLLPAPYYWWEAGGMFNTLINYWYYTGDSTYNEITKQGILWQVGPGDAFMPTNQSFDEGNDDQVFWAFAAMSAAEYNFPNPAPDEPQWLELAQGVFNTQAFRWGYDTCGGGLRWQFNPLNQGYNSKTSAANGGFFNLAARLAAYTGNQTYADWAVRTWDWMYDIGMMSDKLVVFDNTDVLNNCTTMDHVHWSYTTGMILNGAAVMWNQTNSTEWRNRTLQIWESCIPFYFVDDPPMVMREECEPTDQCDSDQLSFKAYLSRFMAASTKVAPWMYDYVKPYLVASAQAAAAQCDGGSSGTECGSNWYQESAYDGTTGVGQQMSALEVIQANLIQQVVAPVSSKTGGTSKGNPATGSNAGNVNIIIPVSDITTNDRIGAGVLTGGLVMLMMIGAWWMMESPSAPPPKASRRAGRPMREKSRAWSK